MPSHRAVRLLLACSLSLLALASRALCDDVVIPEGTPVLGFGILQRLPGLWSGPVTSTTPAGSFDRWYVDFRPVSSSQVSAQSNLDADTRNCMSLFIVKHGGAYKVALRTEGVFQEKGCVTYEAVDTVREAEGYYRFSDFQAGGARAYSEFTFTGDSLVMEVHTSKFGKVSPPELHTRWEAVLADRAPASEATARFGFPKKVVVRDFSTTFEGMPESIYFSTEGDPYDSSSQPYVGEVTVRVSLAEDVPVRGADKAEMLLLLTTRSLFQGIRYQRDNLRFVARYVYLPARAASYTFTGVHPGTYFLYSFCDLNGDRQHTRGDYMSSDPGSTLTLAAKGKATAHTIVDLAMP